LELDDPVLRRRDLGLLPKQAYELRVRLDALHGNPIEGSSLSTAEPRSLPLPSTHPTFAEIG
jgi:hypothetical protein